ncbi:hypothetical protein Tco_0505113 [Tanacetum coccineum]
MRFIPKHETVQAMKELDAYKTYHDFATGKVILKPKYIRRSTREKTDQAPTASPGKRLKATAKVAKSGKKKQHAQGLETLSEIALSKAEQMKIVTKRSKTQFHSTHASSSGANEGTGVSPGVPDVPTYVIASKSTHPANEASRTWIMLLSPLILSLHSFSSLDAFLSPLD